MKQCFKCGVAKPLDAFYKHSRMADGHLNKCKECAKLDARVHWYAHRERYLAQDRARYVPKPRRGFTERFWERVQKTDGCWLWTLALNTYGYGQFRVNNKLRLCHRIAYELEVSPIPAGLLVCHHCDVRNCVRPDHLFVGTVRDNAQDMVAKGRWKNRSTVSA